MLNIKFFLSMVIVVTFCLMAGCSNNESKGSANSEFPPSYTGVVIVNGAQYEMKKGNYQWQRKKGLQTEVVQTDHAAPNQMAEQMEAIRTKPNQQIAIEIENNPDCKIYLWNENGVEKEIKQEANQLIVPSNKGKYIYEVVAEWADGTISYTFVVEVQ
ncbi:hypothetical protein [Metasolibacillus meyeri]|uniref:hypothetical protein n=1 Tax=Metasolibacillus meyeri TaxID=1071052 RepID=UPI001EE76C77|nr:hypothetical protein [Metasolibacillus meyeri]